MDFSILGPVEAVVDGRALALGGPRQRALLAYLLVHANRVVAVDTLVDELWATPPRDAHAALQNQVSRLRKAIGDRLVTKAPGYLLRVEDGELDLDRFRSTVAAAGAATDARERSRLLREADTLFRGAPFAEIDAPFAAAEAAALEELRLAAVEARIDADLERGRQAELVPELAVLVAHQPLRERLRAQQILALYRCGRQAEALDAYRATRTMLDEELGLEPSPALRELERAILRHDPTLAQERVDDEPAAVGALPPSRRRLALAGVALVALAAAGVGSALLLRHRPAPVRTAAAAARHHVRVAATQAKTPVAHVRVRMKARPKRKAHAPTHVRVRVVRTHAVTVAPPPTTTAARTTPPRPATTRTATQPRPPANVTPTVTTETVAPPPADWQLLEDTFSSSTPNWAMWAPNTDGSGASWALRNGRLELSLDAAGQTGGQYDMLSIAFGTRCRFDGDFDARVDYTLLSWPTPAGSRVQLSAWTPDPPYADVARTSNQWGDSYFGDVGGTYNGFPTSDTHGTLRVTRSGALITAYYLEGSTWTALDTGSGSGRIELGLQLFAMASDWVHKDVRIAFDNFRAAAPQVTCN